MGLNNNNKLPPKEKQKVFKQKIRDLREEKKKFPFFHNQSKYIP